MNAVTQINLALTSRAPMPMVSDKASIMRRIAVVCTVQSCARQIWDAPPPASRTGGASLERAIVYAGSHICTKEALVLVTEYFGDHLPLVTDVKKMDRDVRRSLMTKVREAAELEEKLLRKRMSQVTA